MPAGIAFQRNDAAESVPLTGAQRAWDERYKTYDPLSHIYHMHRAVQRYRRNVWFGGFGSGKSVPACWHGISTALKYPGSRGLIARAERVTLRKTTMRTVWDLLGTNATIGGVTDFYDDEGLPLIAHWRKTEWTLVFDNGSEILFDNLERVRSLNLDWLFVDEANEIEQATLDEAIGRVGRNRKVPHPWSILATNIDGLDHMWERYHPESDDALTNASQQERVEKMGGIAVTVTPTQANLSLTSDYVDSLLGLDKITYEQKVDALFVDNRGGRTYYAFDRGRHVGRCEYNPSLPLVHSWDFNERPLCSVVRQENPQGFIQVIKEYRHSPGLTRQMAQAFVEEYRDHQGEVWVRGDATQPGKTATLGTSDYAEIASIYRQAFGEQRVRVQVPRANPGVQNRVNAVNGMLMNARGEQRVLIDGSCRWLIKDLQMVRNGEGTRVPDKTKDKELTHLSDAFGYDMIAEFATQKQVHLPRLLASPVTQQGAE